LDELCDYLGDFYDEFGEEEGSSEYSRNTGSVCVLKVALAYSTKIWRKIALREGQTLHDLHNIIFDAFDRDDEHLYSFFFPHAPGKFNLHKIHEVSTEYTYSLDGEGIEGNEAQNAAMTTIASLGLAEGQVFYYLFDFGDEWWHEITVEKTGGSADEGKYPRIIERKGGSPE
jgi:hypothetical protein